MRKLTRSDRPAEESSDTGEHLHKRCFVISPIGAPKSEVREHADDVFDFIIEPACRRAGYKAHRGDHNVKPGKITDHMFRSILDDPLIIAVLSFQNPNVYFELAVAQSAARPMILLIKDGEDIPFDIKDHRVIMYDLRPRPLFDRVYEDQLYRSIRELERDPAVPRVPFAPHESPLANRSGELKLIARLNDYQPADYMEFLDSSAKFLKISGISLLAWHERVPYIDIIERKAQAGCAVQVLIMDEQNPALGAMLNDYAPVEMVQREIDQSYRRWRELAQKCPNIAVVKARKGIVYQQISLNEHALIYTPYAHSIATGDSPTLETRPTSALYKVQQREFDMLWGANQRRAD